MTIILWREFWVMYAEFFKYEFDFLFSTVTGFIFGLLNPYLTNTYVFRHVVATINDCLTVSA